ncbi:substrate-binding domain-containing protein (plasmid) [Peteryoungia desertarenae]|uniref:Substrate-binding domain-containing protein n=1 Tax=Peteryoungia desertarenae TaxID=1813451 RepID=A0ABX6QTH2_9HYPH|nr:substrate-binding domain-containing protein [Peteryoungia desertarenae]QLF71853.1 substrate-binding domain-containing protein [Peteryoungia desertarenae]
MPHHVPTNLSRIAAILGSFDAHNSPRRSAEIVAEVGMSIGTGYGLIRALVKTGWLVRVDHGWIAIGPRARELMYGPLEPAAALSDAPAVIAFKERKVRESDEQTQIGETWRPDLTEVVETSHFALSRPVRIGFANASLSNSWRLGLLASMEYARRLNDKRIADFIKLSADDDASRQTAQIDTLVASGIDLLIVSCPNINNPALNDQLLALSKQGLPIVALDRRPKDPSSLISFVTASDSRIGRMTAQWMVEKLKPGSRIWMLSGIEGASPAIRRQSAALTVFSNSPGVIVEAVSSTDWTEAGGYKAVDRLLEQSDGRLPDGVWCDSGLQGVGSLRRFLKHGGTIPAHTGGDLNGMYKLVLHHKLPFVAVDYPAAMGARAIEVALDVLSGRPVRRRVEVAAPVVMPRGMETPTIRADIWAEAHVRWDLPDEAILSQGPSLRDVKPANVTRRPVR